MTLTAVDELGLRGRGAVVLRLPTAGAEAAARRRSTGVGSSPVSTMRCRSRSAPGRAPATADSSACVYGCSGASEQLVGRRDLHDLAEVHHRDPVGDVADDGEVVRDEQVGEPELAPAARRAG